MKLQTEVAYLVESKQAFHEIQSELFKRGYAWLTCGNKFRKLQDSDFPRYVGVYDDKLIRTNKHNPLGRRVVTFNKFDRFEKEPVDLNGISVTFHVYSPRDAYALETQLLRVGYKWASGRTRYVERMEKDWKVFDEYDKVYFLLREGHITYGYVDRENTIEFHAGDTIYLHEGTLCVNKVSKQYPVPEEPVKEPEKVMFVEVPFLEVAEHLQNGDNLDDYYIELSRGGLCALTELDASGVGLKYTHITECKFFKREE